MSIPVLIGNTIRLRPVLPGDIQRRLALGTDPEIHRMYGGSRSDLRPFLEEDARRWFAQLSSQPHAWAIERDGALLGDIRLHSLNEMDRRAMVAIGIADPQALGRGYGTEAMQLVLGHAFGVLGLHRVSLRVLAYNARAIASYQKCGFVVEGREREAAFVDGEWQDDVMMGIISTEFSPVRND